MVQYLTWSLKNEQDCNRKHGRGYRIEHEECEVGSFPGRHSSRNPGMGPEAKMCLGKKNSEGT